MLGISTHTSYSSSFAVLATCRALLGGAVLWRSRDERVVQQRAQNSSTGIK